jgi:hypothetical protein
MKTMLLLVACLLIFWPTQVYADGKTKAIQETAEWIAERFGRQITQKGMPSLVVRLESYVAKYGDGFLHAIRNVGPRAFQVVDDMGAMHASRAIGIMSRHGEKGLVNILTRPQALKLVTHLGETAEAALVKHPAIAEKVIASHGAPAIRAMQSLGTQGGRRLAMLSEAGDLARLGRTEELLSVIGRFGEKGMQFIWDHKGALMVTGAITAFLANPEPFIEGTVKLTSEVISSAVKPLAEVPKVIAEHAASSINWTLVALCLIASCSGMALWKFHRRQRPPTACVS